MDACSDVVGTRDYGGSLPVENVQALATKKLIDIPTRYVRPELESDIVLNRDSKEIPVINFNRPVDPQSSTDESTRLHLACKDWGFFQLINHGVPNEIISNMKDVLKEFFALPIEEKQIYAQPPNSLEGYGQAFVVSDEQKLDWADMFYLSSLPVHERNHNLFPRNPISFREAFDRYSKELKRLSDCLLGSISLNLGCEGNKLTDMFEDGVQSFRMNYYPPCLQANKVIGISPHSDPAGLTLLLQVNEVQGLQIRKDGNWFPVTPMSSSFICNIGDIIEILSNGEYKSIEHRAVINFEKERLSIAAFHGPNNKFLLGPLPDHVKGRVNYKTVCIEEFFRLYFSRKLDGKRVLDLMKV